MLKNAEVWEVVLIAHITLEGKEETVAEHTKKTMQLCKSKGERCGISEIMSLCAICHDLGKEKKKFSDYLHSDEQTKQRLRGTIAHASTGAKYVYDKYHNTDNMNQKILAELIAYCIAAHHGLFDCDRFSEKINRVADYQEACENSEREILADYSLEIIFKNANQEFCGILNKIAPLIKEKSELCFYLSCLQRLMLSVLIDSDWEATSEFMGSGTSSEKKDISSEEIFRCATGNLDHYIQELDREFAQSERTQKECDIQHVRKELQAECREFAKHSAGIYCLPIPTGGGKTLSSLAYALEFGKEHKQTERIIYVSPYISVTEQNADVFRKAIKNEKWILEHHSSVVQNIGDTGEDYETEQIAQADINWEEPFICTTFVQFMNTLFSDRKAAIRRMHRLVNTVIIIDEVQSMPIKCINTFNCMMNFLNVVCNTNIILCTATQPQFGMVEHPIHYASPQNMVNNLENRFLDFDRVEFKYKKEPYAFDELKEEIVNRLNDFDSILAILNTKTAVRKLYDLLNTENVRVEYLTTNLCAEHRSDRIKDIKEVLNRNYKGTENNKEKIVVISTNLIEAGVDISFECVYRSMAGLDSIAQAAGRCNRNGEREKGEVCIIRLKDEKIGAMTELKCAQDTLNKVLYYGKFDENENILLPKWMDQYFQNLYGMADLKDCMMFPVEDMDTNIYEMLSIGFQSSDSINFMNQAYKTAGKKYKVIDNHSIGIIVPYKDGKGIIKQLEQTSDISVIKKYVRMAQRYTVNVNGTQMKQLQGLIKPVSEYLQGVFIPAVPGIYHEQYGITGELETFII